MHVDTPSIQFLLCGSHVAWSGGQSGVVGYSHVGGSESAHAPQESLSDGGEEGHDDVYPGGSSFHAEPVHAYVRTPLAVFGRSSHASGNEHETPSCVHADPAEGALDGHGEGGLHPAPYSDHLPSWQTNLGSPVHSFPHLSPVLHD